MNHSQTIRNKLYQALVVSYQNEKGTDHIVCGHFIDIWITDKP